MRNSIHLVATVWIELRIPEIQISLQDLYFGCLDLYICFMNGPHELGSGSAGPGPADPDPSSWGPFIKQIYKSRHPKYKSCNEIWISGMRNSIHTVATRWIELRI